MFVAVNSEAILNMQRKLYQWSRQDPNKVFADLFNLVCDRCTLALAWQRLCRNTGSRTPGLDGVTRRKIEERPGGVPQFLEEIRQALRDGTYRPQPVRQHLIPKSNKPGQFRPLGIPTLRDRLVQMALKLVLEPIFEADFYPTSYGFRPGRSTLDALSMIQLQLRPHRYGNALNQYVIEGDIRACFESIDHHRLMDTLRERIGDRQVLRLLLAFLKAGVMAEGAVRHPVTGTPQGGVISPLLANVYLTKLDARYQRWIPSPGDTSPDTASQRVYRDRRRGRPTFFLIRYADDFVILTDGTQEEAETEKAALAIFLREELGMELSTEKTLITHAEKGFVFLGYRVLKARARRTGRLVGKLYIPLERIQRVCQKLKQKTTRSTTALSMDGLLNSLNSLITGWRNYYQYAVGAYTAFAHLDWWLWDRVRRWVKKKHPRRTGHEMRRQYTRSISPTRWTWCGEKVQLRLFTRGGTKRYHWRGLHVANGWNDDIDLVTPYTEVMHPIAALHALATYG